MNNFLFFLFALASIPLMSECPWWSIALTCSVALHAYLASQSYFKVLSFFWTGTISLVVLLIVYNEFGNIFGPEPASAYLVVLGALKLEEVRNRRDTMILLLLNVLMVMYYLLFNQSLAATAYMFLMLFLIAFGLISAQTPRNAWDIVSKAAPRTAIKDIALSAPLFIIMFVLFPRFSTPWASFMGEEKNPVGFSDRLQPGEMADLLQSEEPAFRVTFKNQNSSSSQASLYWRGAIFDETVNGWNWSSHEMQTNINRRANVSSKSDVEYELTLEPRFDKKLFVMEHTEDVQWLDSTNMNPIILSPNSTYISKWPIGSRQTYKARASSESSQAFTLSQSEQSRLTEIKPPSAEVAELVRRLKFNSSLAKDFADNLLKYFQQENFSYVTKTPTMNSLDDFLFQEKKGFCEHFATASAALFRYANIPARVVVGFRGAEPSFFNDYFLIRDKNAHAWMEYYSDEKWHRLDPTSAVSATWIQAGQISDDQSLTGGLGSGRVRQWFRKFSLLYDQAEFRYSQLLLNYNFSAQMELLRWDGSKKWLRTLLIFLTFGLCTLIVWFFYRWSLHFKSQDVLAEAMSRLRSHLLKKNIPIAESDGPLRMTRLCIEKYPDKEKQISDYFSHWIETRYGRKKLTSETLRRLKNYPV